MHIIKKKACEKSENKAQPSTDHSEIMPTAKAFSLYNSLRETYIHICGIMVLINIGTLK